MIGAYWCKVENVIWSPRTFTICQKLQEVRIFGASKFELEREILCAAVAHVRGDETINKGPLVSS
jgi:hypothetical protein